MMVYMSHMTITENERGLLKAIVTSEYNDGHDTSPVWVDCLWGFEGKAKFGGVMASLTKKGLAKTDGECAWVTEAGLELYKSLTSKGESIMKTVADIANESTKGLVAFYNRFNPAKPVKKFSDRATAEARVKEIIEKMNTPVEEVQEPPVPAVAAQMAANEVEAAAPVAPPTKSKISKEDKAAAKTAEQGVKDKAKADKKAAAAEQKAKDAADKKRINAERIERQKKERDEAKAAKAAAGKGFRAEPIEEKIHAVRAGSKVAQIIDLISRPEGATIDEMQPLMSPKATVRGILSYDIRTMCGYGFYSTDGVTVHILYPAGMKKPLAHAVALTAQPKPDAEAVKAAKAAVKAAADAKKVADKAAAVAKKAADKAAKAAEKVGKTTPAMTKEELGIKMPSEGKQ